VDSRKSLSPAADPVDELLRKWEAAGKGRAPTFPVGCVSCFGLYVAGSVICTYESTVGTLIALVAVVAGFLLMSRLTASRSQKRAAVQLATCNDVRVIGPLLASYYWPDIGGNRFIIANALTRLLPTVRDEHDYLLTQSNRDALRMILSSKDRPLVVASLAALTHLGDSRHVQAVKQLAINRAGGAGDPTVKEAARACLRALEQRTELSGYTLLRVPDESGGSHLRPSESSGQAVSALLLRPDGGTMRGDGD
jgi:hypothetical protein